MRLASHGLVIIDHGYSTTGTLLHDSWKALQSKIGILIRSTQVLGTVEKCFSIVSFLV